MWRGDVHQAPTRPVCAREHAQRAAAARSGRIELVREVVAEAPRAGPRASTSTGRASLNAAVASGVPAAEYRPRVRHRHPLPLEGARLPARRAPRRLEERMAKARRLKHLFGGAMRQAGVVAAAGIYALDHNVDRLADDHANAKRLAEGSRPPGSRSTRPRSSRTSSLLDAAALGLTVDEAAAASRPRACSVSGRSQGPSGPSPTSTFPRTTSSRRSRAPRGRSASRSSWSSSRSELARRRAPSGRARAMPVRVVVHEPARGRSRSSRG